jgi:hypothetical protein
MSDEERSLSIGRWWAGSSTISGQKRPDRDATMKRAFTCNTERYFSET